LREDKPAKQVVREVKARVRTAGKTAAKHGALTHNAKAEVSGIALSHPDRVYWQDAGVTKRDLAEFYAQIWHWMRPHVVGRPISLLRCPSSNKTRAALRSWQIHAVPRRQPTWSDGKCVRYNLSAKASLDTSPTAQ